MDFRVVDFERGDDDEQRKTDYLRRRDHKADIMRALLAGADQQRAGHVLRRGGFAGPDGRVGAGSVERGVRVLKAGSQVHGS